MVLHLRPRGVLVARLDRLDDPGMVLVDRAVEDAGEPGAGEARLQGREDGLGGDLQQPVVTALDQGRVEFPVCVSSAGRSGGIDSRSRSTSPS